MFALCPQMLATEMSIKSTFTQTIQQQHLPQATLGMPSTTKNVLDECPQPFYHPPLCSAASSSPAPPDTSTLRSDTASGTMKNYQQLKCSRQAPTGTSPPPRIHAAATVLLLPTLATFSWAPSDSPRTTTTHHQHSPFTPVPRHGHLPLSRPRQASCTSVPSRPSWQ